MNKRILVLIALGIIPIVLSLGTGNVAAQAPTNTFPGGAAGLDNQFHTIPANTHLWYFFEYSGDNTQFSIVLVGGARDKLDFNLYLPTQVTLPDQWVTNPIGRGSQPGISCPAGSGNCDQDNKIWLGGFNISGRYYVEVINNNAQNLPFQLKIVGGGDSIALHPPTATVAAAAAGPAATRTQPRAVSTSAPAAPNAILTVMAQVAATLEAPLASVPSSSTTGTPRATTQAATTAQPTSVSQATGPTATPSASPTPDNFWWTSALYVVDDRRRVIPPKADLWFKFDYGGDRSQITVRIPDAKLSLIEFKVYTTEQVVNYEKEDKFVGVGSPSNPDSNELRWIGSDSQNRTYYLRVTNTSDKYANFVLIVSGSNVSLGR